MNEKGKSTLEKFELELRSAGHKKTDTTRMYIQLSHNLVKMAKSPLNNIRI